jgi:hypothetical protein
MAFLYSLDSSPKLSNSVHSTTQFWPNHRLYFNQSRVLVFPKYVLLTLWNSTSATCISSRSSAFPSLIYSGLLEPLPLKLQFTKVQIALGTLSSSTSTSAPNTVLPSVEIHSATFITTLTLPLGQRCAPGLVTIAKGPPLFSTLPPLQIGDASIFHLLPSNFRSGTRVMTVRVDQDYDAFTPERRVHPCMGSFPSFPMFVLGMLVLGK